MKRLVHFMSVLVFIIFLFASCNTKTPIVDSKTNDNENRDISIGRTEAYDNNQDSIQLIPEVQIPVPIPAPSKEAQPSPKVIEPKQSVPPSSTKKATTTKSVPKRIVLGKYHTPLLNRHKDRVSNIRLAAKRIDGYKLQPGETFSFNDIVGKRDAKSGFKKAAIIVNGEFDEDMGGGVCQLSSTLYNAADKADLQIIERHSHSRKVGYLSSGRDAAVSYGYLDLKFKNTKEYPLEIAAWVKDNKVYASILKAK